MFLAIIFIAIGLAILLSTLGITSGSFLGFFWSIIFIVVGLKMIANKKSCPICGWHGAITGRADDSCECECDCGHTHQ